MAKRDNVYSTRLNDYEAEAIKMAARRWREHAGSDAELLRAIINDWRETHEQSSNTVEIMKELASLREEMRQEFAEVKSYVSRET